MNENLLQAHKRMNVGGGIMKSLPVGILNITNNGAALTATTSDDVYASNSNGLPFVVYKASTAGDAMLSFQLPIDYDDTEYVVKDPGRGDELVIEVDVQSGTGAKVISPSVNVGRTGGTAPTIADPADFTTTATVTTNTLNLSGNGLRPRDYLSLVLTADVSTATTALIWDVRVLYRGNIVATSDTER
jgi:hypothetical protein